VYAVPTEAVGDEAGGYLDVQATETPSATEPSSIAAPQALYRVLGPAQSRVSSPTYSALGNLGNDATASTSAAVHTYQTVSGSAFSPSAANNYDKPLAACDRATVQRQYGALGQPPAPSSCDETGENKKYARYVTNAPALPAVSRTVYGGLPKPALRPAPGYTPEPGTYSTLQRRAEGDVPPLVDADDNVSGDPSAFTTA